MASTEFIHVTQFLETIFCFSILILIGQRFVMTWKNLDDKYLKERVKQYQDQLNWQRLHTSQNSNLVQNQQGAAQQENSRKSQQNVEPPQQPGLRTSLVENEQNQTARNMVEHVEQPPSNMNKRKSLTDLIKEQEQKSVKQIEINDYSEASTERKKSVQINQVDNQSKKRVSDAEKPQFLDLNNQQPSIISNYSNQQTFKKQALLNAKIHIFTLIDCVFDQHIPILMSMLILGIIVHSTYIFAMVCFFGYILTHLTLKHANSLSKLRRQPQPSRSFKLSNIVPKLWIIALFISYWSDSQYS